MKDAAFQELLTSVRQAAALLRDVREAESQVAAGKVMTHAAVARKLRARLARR